MPIYFHLTHEQRKLFPLDSRQIGGDLGDRLSEGLLDPSPNPLLTGHPSDSTPWGVSDKPQLIPGMRNEWNLTEVLS